MKKKQIDLAFTRKEFDKIIKKSRKGSVIILDESGGTSGMSSLAMASAKSYCVPQILGHFGTCDMCGVRFKRVIHMNYDVQPERDFRA